MNKDVVDKTREIVDFIKASPNYQRYLNVIEKMKENDQINNLVSEIKILQKKIVNHHNEKDILEEKINEKLEELNGIPLYNEFVNLQEELNNNINYVKSTLNDYFNNIIN